MADGIYLSNDRVQSLNGDLFEQNARQTLGDVWEQQASAAMPDMVRQAQQDEQQRQAAIDAANQQQRNVVADQFETAAPSMAAQHLASLNADVAPSPPSGTIDSGPSNAAVEAPSVSGLDAGAAPATPPPPAQPAPSAPVTAPMSNPAATQQPISAPAAATPTTAGISGGGDLSGRVGARGQQILSSAADAASWLGDQGQKALQAVLMTEGGLAGARGDQGKCYDGETRVLTRRGFVYFADLVDEDELATRRADGVIEYHRPLARQHYRYSGEMYRFKGWNIDLLVTPNHNMLAVPHYELWNNGRRVKGQPRLVQAQEMSRYRYWKVPAHARWLGDAMPDPEGPVDCTAEQWAAFAGLWLAEGYAAPPPKRTEPTPDRLGRRRPVGDGRTNVAITQAVGDTSAPVRRIVEGIGVKYSTQYAVSTRLGWRDKEQHVFYNRALHTWLKPLGKDAARYIPRDLLQASPEVLVALLMGLMLGDGSRARVRYTTTSKQLAEDVAELGIKLGWGASVKLQAGARKVNWNPVYKVNFRAEEYFDLDLTKHMTVVPEWEGDVYCATVPNHTLLVERHGKITWCANSAGPLQFYEGGQLANFAQQMGMGLEQAKQYVEAQPEAAIQWAIGTPDRPGYLGGAIQRGLQAGLQGADLATYAQRHGQVSVSPERAGQNWQNLFGGGQDVIAGAGQAVADVATGAGRVVSAAVNHVIENLRPSQFGVGLSNGEAYAACGPVAAMAFARATGRNPTAQEAVELAKRVGWTAAQGMAGPSSELDLLKSMGVASHMENGADPNKIAQDVQNGNPVIISTPGHYFVADGYNPQTGQFHVGTSGTDLRAGSEWMTLDGMQKVMGSAQATLYLDRQPGDGPSVAAQMAQAPTTPASPTYMGVNQPGQPSQPQPTSPIDAFKQKLGDAFSDLFAPLQNLFGGSSSTPTAPEGGGYGVVPPGGVNPLPDIFAGIGQAAQTGQQNLAARGIQLDQPGSQTLPGVQHSLADAGIQLDQPGSPTLPQTPLTTENFPSVLDPNHPANVYTDLAQKYASPSDPLNLHVRDRMTPEDQAKWDSLAAQVGGVEMPTLPEGAAFGAAREVSESKVADLMPKAEPAAPTNPFALETQAGPGLLPMTEEDIASHLEDLGTRYETNDARIQELENQLGGGGLGPGGVGVQRPPWAVGLTNDAITQIARDQGTSAYKPLWWEGIGFNAGSREVQKFVGEGGYRGTGAAQLTPTQARAELNRLMAENDQIMAATDVPEGATTLYRRMAQTAPDLPWQAYTPPANESASVPASSPTGAGPVPAVGSPTQTFAARANQGGAAANPPTAPAGIGTSGGPLNLTPVDTGGAVLPSGGYQGPTGPQPGQLDLGLNAAEIHPRIQELFGGAPEYRQIAQQGLDDLVQSGANPTQIGRYFAGLERNAGVNQPELSVGGIGANDWFRALRNGAMAGGLSTLGHVFLNIPLQTVASVPREALASAFRGAPEQIPASLIGLFKGYSAGWEAASQQLRYGLSGAEAATGDLASVTPALRATNRVSETAYNALQGLVSTHGVAQTFMENVGFIQKLTQQAWTMAKNEGLSGSAFTNRVEQIVKNAAIDPQYSDMLVTAQQYGQRMALRGAQGTLGRGARGIAQAGPLGNLLVPFEGIAYNVVTRGIELTPAGPLGTGLDVARKTVGLGPYAAGASKAGAAAVAPVSERLANNVLGLGLLAYGLDLATHGRVVGHGPDDPTERRAWMDQGGQPDSFVVDGQPNASGQIVGGRYISGHLFGQFFYPFATAAAITESQRAAQGKGDQNMPDVMADSVRRLGEYVSNETWLRSVAQITDALKTEGGAAQKLETLAANMAESFVPQTALFRNVEQATDPYARQAAKGDLAGRLATAYPGLAGTQPVRQSLTGEPVANPNQGVGIFAPTGRGAPDPVIQLFGNAGIGVPPPPTHVRVTSKYEMDLQPDEQRQYQDIRGQALRELTQEFVNEPDFASLPIEKQRTYLQKAMTKADDMARKQFLDQMPDAQIEQRVQAYQGTKTPRPFAYVGSP